MKSVEMRNQTGFMGVHTEDEETVAAFLKGVMMDKKDEPYCTKCQKTGHWTHQCLKGR